jgi:hypothetical protein
MVWHGVFELACVFPDTDHPYDGYFLVSADHHPLERRNLHLDLHPCGEVVLWLQNDH